MTSYLVVSINPLPGLDAEFNDWYTNIHLGEVIAVDGIRSGQRFALSDAQVVASQPHRYVTFYEIDSENTAAALQRLQAALPTMRIPAVSDSKTTAMAVFDAITDVKYPASGARAQNKAGNAGTWLLVGTTPYPGMEEEFNDWYTNVHLPEVLAIDGFWSAQRLSLSSAQPHNGPQPYQYLALYEIDGSDTAAVLRRLQEAIPKMQLKPVSDPKRTYMAAFDAITDRIQ